MNLNIRQTNATKSYVVTDVCTTRPRIVIKDGNNVSYLPLTTSAKQGFGLRNKVNGVNYRPLEYQSMSTSATYYTTAVASNGLSSTTALTRSSTSQTVYHTCSSTSGTSYLTRSSTSGTSYLTQSIPNNLGYSGTFINSSSFNNYKYYSKAIYRTTATSFTIWNSAQTYTAYKMYGTANFNGSISYTQELYSNDQLYTSGSSTQTAGYQVNGINMYCPLSSAPVFFQNQVIPSFITIYTGNVTCISRSTNLSYHSQVLTGEFRANSYGYVNSYSETDIMDWRTSLASTTGTSYLTRASTSATSYLTRSSTSRTEYKTRASTSGYSGVSSSSSQSSGWL